MSKRDDSLPIPEFSPARPWLDGRLNTLIRRVNALWQATIARGGADKFTASERGVIIQLAEQGATTVSEAGTLIGYYSLVACLNDTLQCVAWSPGGALGSAVVYVAKDPKIRESVRVESPAAGKVWRYDYTDGIQNNRVRIKTEDGVTGSELQMVAPAWCPGEVIIAAQMATGLVVGGKPVTLQHIGGGRAWARI